MLRHLPPEKHEEFEYMLTQPIPGRVVTGIVVDRATVESDTASFLAAGANLGGG